MVEQGCVCSQGGGLPDGQGVLEGFGFDWSWPEPQASALVLVRLTNDSDQVHFGPANQGSKRATSQFRRSKKNCANCFHIRALRPAAVFGGGAIFRFYAAG